MSTLTLPKGLHAAGLAWQILRDLAAHPGPVHYTTIAQRIRHRRPQSIQRKCAELAGTGHLRWVRPGVYHLPHKEDYPMADTDAVYDRVMDALVGTKYHLEALQRARAHGQHDPEAEAATLAGLIPHLARAAEVFQTWWKVHGEAGR